MLHQFCNKYFGLNLLLQNELFRDRDAIVIIHSSFVHSENRAQKCVKTVGGQKRMERWVDVFLLVSVLWLENVQTFKWTVDACISAKTRG